ncbi:MAG TPA: hypothetical protein VG826_29140 [Pirellulales bacterium]|nr:hypothetical protein [Pirellulales bacterium]
MSRRPWPSDATIIVCASLAEARTEFMESVNPGHCRDCGAPLVYDGKTERRCLALCPGRPIGLLCIPCAVRYDVRSIEHLEDHRGGTFRIVPRGPGPR